MILESNPEQRLAAKIESLRARQNELTPAGQNELDRLSKHALDLAETNARYREHQSKLLLAKQEECERLRQHALRLDEQSAREKNIVKRKVLRWLASEYLSNARAGNVGVKLRHIVVPYVVILVLCVAALLYACRLFLEFASQAYAHLTLNEISTVNIVNAVGPVVFALLLGAVALWGLWGMYRTFNR